MSKRVTLTDSEIELIINGLKYLQSQTALSYEVVKCGQRAIQHVIDKLYTKIPDKKSSTHD